MAQYELRWYQKEASESAVDSILSGKCKNPLVVMPTGSGKTIVIADTVRRYVEARPCSKIVVISDRKSILCQNYKALCEYLPHLKIGMFSSGLGKKEIRRITVCGIQTVANCAERFKDFDLAIVDECHLIPPSGDGRYRKFLSVTGMPVIGFTATNFRLGHGYIHKGKNAIFDEVVYDLSSEENFNRLIKEGYLTNLISKGTLLKLDLDGVRTVAGDFKLDDLSIVVDRASITEKAIEEIIKFGKNYKKWLIFAIDIKHAEHINELLIKNGINSACVHSKMDGDYDEEIDLFKKGNKRALVNVNILTTGFDDPEIDLIALLRPTKSPVLHVQMIGRGSRVVTGKTHCLVLDFAGNVNRLGPINSISIKQKGDKTGSGGDMVKECPECKVHNHISSKRCFVCDFEFIFKEKLKSTADTSDVVRQTNILPYWLEVKDVYYYIYQNEKGRGVRASYHCNGNVVVHEYICIEYPDGWAKRRAKQISTDRIGKEIETCDEFVKEQEHAMPPLRIQVVDDGKFKQIIRMEY